MAPVVGSGGSDRDVLAAAVSAFVGIPLAKVERLVIEANIRSCDGSLPKAARVLGVSPSTLYRKRAGWIDPLPEP
jgi:DNA-binding NtrC family response regulator